MWELDCEESWAPKNCCFWTVVLEKTRDSPLDCKEIQPVHSEGDQPWDFFGRNDTKAETPVLWPPHVKSWLIGKDPGAGRDWGQEKGKTEDEMAGWHHRLDGRESEWTPGFGDGQGGLAYCDSWGHKELDTTDRLNWTEWKAGSQETPGVTGKFGLGIRNEAAQRLIEFCQDNTLVIANTLFQQHKRRLYIWTSPDGQTPKSYCLYSLQPKMEKLYTVSKNKTGSWLWLRSWASYCQIQTYIEESRGNH